MHSPAGTAIRPTADRLRESIFNILDNRVRGTRVLDLYAGTGALGIEALSRGASHAVFIDEHVRALDLIRRNIAKVRAADRTTVLRWDIAQSLNCLRGCAPFDLIFMDPPYGRGLVRKTLTNLLAAGVDFGWVVAEHDRRESVQSPPTGMHLEDQRCYGKTLVSFLTGML